MQFVKKTKILKTVAVTAAILCLVVCVCEAVDMCITWHKSCGHVRHAHHVAQVLWACQTCASRGTSPVGMSDMRITWRKSCGHVRHAHHVAQVLWACQTCASRGASPVGMSDMRITWHKCMIMLGGDLFLLFIGEERTNMVTP